MRSVCYLLALLCLPIQAFLIQDKGCSVKYSILIITITIFYGALLCLFETLKPKRNSKYVQ
jgi:hypothetical protein